MIFLPKSGGAPPHSGTLPREISRSSIREILENAPLARCFQLPNPLLWNSRRGRIAR
jgi:hypothetical protein